MFLFCFVFFFFWYVFDDRLDLILDFERGVDQLIKNQEAIPWKCKMGTIISYRELPKSLLKGLLPPVEEIFQKSNKGRNIQSFGYSVTSTISQSSWQCKL